jgi:hypothetical protein
VNTFHEHAIIVHHQSAFLLRMMVALAGNATMSLEGNIYDLRFLEGILSGTEETPLLKRVSRPPQGFLVLRLEPKFVEPIFQQIEDIKVMRTIIHLQIERRGILELSAYDRFEYTTSGPGASAAFLQRLKDAKVISNFVPIHQSR